METKPSRIPSQNEIHNDGQRLPWHKPTVERLSITLDTAAPSGGPASVTDFGAGSV